MQFRAGDKIKVTLRTGDRTLTYEGVADRKDSYGDWLTEGGYVLPSNHSLATVEILEQAIPPFGTKVRTMFGKGVIIPAPTYSLSGVRIGEPIIAYTDHAGWDDPNVMEWEVNND